MLFTPFASFPLPTRTMPENALLVERQPPEGDGRRRWEDGTLTRSCKVIILGCWGSGRAMFLEKRRAIQKFPASQEPYRLCFLTMFK